MAMLKIIITNNENLGFAKACTKGLRAAVKVNTPCSQNNDNIPQAGWVQRALVEEVQAHSDVAVVEANCWRRRHDSTWESPSRVSS